MPATASARARKQLGAWPTPGALVDLVVERTIDHELVARSAGRPVRVLDPACGDGRFLLAAHSRLAALGVAATLTGVDLDPTALEQARDTLRGLAGVELVHDDARCWGVRTTDTFDVVVGNPPFLSQLATQTTRGGASRFGGGAYADVAAEFLALAVGLAAPRGGRVGLVLPQSILAARDAGAVRDLVDSMATMTWSWWSPRRQFDAEVLVCALGFERSDRPSSADWTRPVLDVVGVPPLPALRSAGTVGDRATATANFRDEYYGLTAAVGDDVDGPPLVTSGLIDAGACAWGSRPVRFARRDFAAPRVDLTQLDERMQRWATRKLVPKVLVANQTSIVEAVADPSGAWLPGVPVVTVTPGDPALVWDVAAVLTSPAVSAWVWQRAAGTGLSARTVRLRPDQLASAPWPAGPLTRAADALRAGDVVACGREVQRAFGLGEADELEAWWAGLAVTPGREPRGRAGRRDT